MKKLLGGLLAGAGVAAIVAMWWSSGGSGSQKNGTAESSASAGQHPTSNAQIQEDAKAKAPPSVPTGVAALPATTLVEVIQLPQPAKPEIGAFREWAGRYFAASAADRAAMVPEGIRLAQQHRQALKVVVMTDPRTALEQAVPMVVRQDLPPEIVAQLEERLSGVGPLEVLAVSPDSDPSEPTVRRFATLNGQEYRAHVYGRRGRQMSVSAATLNGVAVDNEFAVSESPLRRLETGERPDAAKQAVEVCPVSGESTTVERSPQGTLPPVTVETPAVEAGTQIIYLCDGGHFRQVEEELIAGEGATGGPTAPTGTFPITRVNSTGIRKIIYLRLTFPDALQEPQTEKDAYANLKTIADYFQESSYGRLTFMGTVAPTVLLPRTAAWYITDYNTTGSNSPIMNDAKEAARKLGFPPEDYHHFVVIYTGGPGSFGGLGSVNGPNTWLKTTSVGTAEHELGHNVGVWHSNSWNTSGVSSIGSGANVEYGHTNDVMGSSGSGGHFNASMKEQLQWITPETYTTVRRSGVYRIHQFDQVRQDPGLRYALRVAKDADRDYWLEFRQKLSSNPWFTNGVTLNWSPWGFGSGADNGTALGSNRGTQLLDMTPGSPDDRTDAPLVIGRTFSDYEADVHITPIGKGGTAPESIDVVVNTGTMAAGNLPPTFSLGASATTVALNATVNFTATASDPNGDTLAYSWDFGDKLASFNSTSFSTVSSATASKTFTAAGYYQVQCTVSDMKGGREVRSVLITVGAPSTVTISGTVVDGLGNPLPGVRVHNGLTTSNYRGAYSDATGAFCVTNLSSTAVTLQAVKEGYSLAVSGGGAVQNFTATQSAVKVAIQATDADAAEDSNPGQFRITRTGSTTAALTVYVDFTGTAGLNSDYQLSPAATTTSSPLESFVIPAGSSFLDVAINMVADSAQEGPETVVMSLINASGYQVSGPQTVQVTIADNDTSLPQVALEVDDPEATEGNPADTGRFVISRTGSTASALTVNFTVDASTGSATNGTDFTSISSVVIPAGASFVPLEVTPLNDTLMEGLELVTVTVATNAAYVRHPALISGTVKIIDDETPVVTIAATDATGNENGDPIRFTLTRTGSTTQELVVHYAVGGEALHGADYLALPGFVTFAQGSATAVVDLFPVQDSHGEPAQSVSLQLRSSTQYILGSPSNASASIVDDGDLPVVSVALTDGAVAEGSTANPGTFRITTTGTGSGNITVNFTVTGTAASGVDYTSVGTSVVMGKNTTANVVVTPLNDSLQENAETVVLSVQPSSSYQLDLQSAGTMVIEDDDSVNMVSVTATTNSVTEGGNARFYVSRSVTTTSALVVKLGTAGTATAGTDYTAPAATVTIPASALGVVVDVGTLTDSLVEGAETLALEVLPDPAIEPLYGIESGRATMVLNDGASSGFASSLAFAQTSLTVNEDVGTATLTVNRTGSLAGTSTVNYVIYGGTALGGGVDYRLGTGALTFGPGVSSQTIEAAVQDDLLPEDVETVCVLLQEAGGAALTTATAQCTLLILDNEPRLSLAVESPFAFEGRFGQQLNFRLTRTGSTAAALVVPVAYSGTAVSGTDYPTRPATITIPAGVQEIFSHFPPSADALGEGEETVILTLEQGSGYVLTENRSATACIGDVQQNNAPLLFLRSPRLSTSGLQTAATLWLDVLTADDELPVPATYAWTKASGPGTVTFTAPFAASSGARFSTAGRYVLRLTAGDGAKTSTLDVPVTVLASTNTWSQSDVGTLALPGSGASQYGTHAVNGSGSSLTSSSDTFALRHRRLTGDGEIIARVRHVAGTSGSARVGVMLRESTLVGSRMAAMLMAPATSNLSAAVNRTTASTSASTVSTSGVSPGYWVRLARAGDVITAYDSVDGVQWAQRGAAQTFSGLSSDLLAGIAVVAVSSSTPPRLNTGLVDNVQVIGTADNLAPLANAGPDGTAEVGVPRTLAGVVTDADGPALAGGAQTIAWSQVSGPPGVVFGNASSASTTVTFPQGGVYALRLTADDGGMQTMDEVTITLDTAEVSIYAYHDPAREDGFSPGGFLVLRKGNLSRALVVNFSLAGSVGQEGVDFEPMGTTVTIPVNADSAFILMHAIPDTLAEGSETVQGTLLPGAYYTITEDSVASNYIEDLHADEWRYEQFGANANGPGSGIMEDFDGDGVINLLEYAFHSDATVAGANLPVLSMNGSALTITYTRDRWAQDIEYHPEWSTSLGVNGWSGSGVVEQVTPVDLRFESVRATYTPAPGTPHCFMRVRIVKP
ncbi:Calx-beta domain-containing protein [Verrucomicrobium sp. BvORR106]|uniref:Calx-beta domain-containing protein n=1 Tax=Verrucomicrobium sp. BvORR106 TaxID=1403819 RepID=UPI00056DA3ED|nr:Calx-beta domain-containing protein [Verrucomicrobium sp. BvORR106]